jgi:ArsR family metal-binding transcriptional regulator
MPENTSETKLVNFSMANPTRKKIINSLSNGDKSIEEIREITGKATFEFHLKILQEANLIEFKENNIKLSEYGQKFLKNKIEKGGKKPADLSEAKKVEITGIRQLLPCIADSSKFRAIANMEPPLGEVLKVFEPLFSRGNYSDRKSSLIIQKGEIITTIYGSGKVSMRMIKSEDEAREELERLKGIINEAIETGVVPEPKVKIKVELMEIYKYLPKTNCRKCNEQSCYTFAIKLMAGEIALEECPVLKEQRYASNKEYLEILAANI